MVNRSYEPAFPLRLAAKDAALVEEAAKAGGFDPEILQTIRSLYDRAAADGHADEDMAAVHEAL
jgi:3-hydroxyisobutyrate dehydrogenase